MKLFSFYFILTVVIEIILSLNASASAFIRRHKNNRLHCYYAEDQCPNKDIQFWLYTKGTEQNPLLLDLLNLKPDSFPERLPLKILLHGLGLDHDLSPNEELRPLLLQYERVYIISVDYKNLSRVLCLTPWALQNCRIIAKCLALLITNLVDQIMYSPDDIHLIGFSLGAQIAGLSANHLNYRVKRITGLDPAGPTFDTDNINERLDPTDAQFVDVIHTDPRFLSISRAMGHADFYPNYLKLIQPGCSPIEEYSKLENNTILP
ncbi:pancreatic lipase-related protein 2-like, partial [Lucilia cuprina]|uniref:pancreatic lipase-related protein 2-like n=1 Tax=Lucilia cuprina TaxID=7375 RepID=UPI001F0530DE